MHPFWFGRKAISDSPGSSQPDVQALGAAKSTVVRCFALALIGELMADPASEYLPAIKNGNAPPTSSRRT
jgi:hypothetical protein